jgi:hypothetical protein
MSCYQKILTSTNETSYPSFNLRPCTVEATCEIFGIEYTYMMQGYKQCDEVTTTNTYLVIKGCSPCIKTETITETLETTRCGPICDTSSWNGGVTVCGIRG